ncbi:MAG: aminotransferase class III-fold pyridoxal phosphate-dependent enzyme [Nitrospirales bacterium]|nr:aminotransferase class III-fold pyridoxal phosphate-dependent enzyme [Nitrospirales bacterium]
MKNSSKKLPQFTSEEATTLARDLYGVTGPTRPLPSERDQNFLIESSGGAAFVLKIANASEVREILEAQNAALEFLAERETTLRCPRVIVSRSGQPILTTQAKDGTEHCVRLLSYVPGHLLVRTRPYSGSLLEGLGKCFGLLDQTLKNFFHPALQRTLEWDLRNASAVVSENLFHISDSHQRSLIESNLERFQKFTEPVFPTLQTSIIHNDGNDYNILVTDVGPQGGSITGLIDFGDMIESHTIFDLAICTAYAILDTADPITAAAQVVSGYHQESPLTEIEVDLLYDLIAMRLCTSVVAAARQKKLHPDNAYLTVSEGPAWGTLEQISRLSPRLFSYAFRDACGWSPCPQAVQVVHWLNDHSDDFSSVVEPATRSGDVIVFDRSPGSSEFIEVPDPTDTSLATSVMLRKMAEAGVSVGVGRYNEANRAYTASAYRQRGDEVERSRTIHLGTDLFMRAGSTVFAPLEGIVHSFQNNNQIHDYGPTIILQHAVEGDLEFYTLYGHLSLESLKNLSVGMPLKKGDRIGTIGDPSINGQWPPHLHFQIITDLLNYSGDFPGVCAPVNHSLWLSLCPDPNLILQIPSLHDPDLGLEPKDLLEVRNRYLGKALSISYKEPLKLVRGWMQYVYDHLGREYLDAINNVNHVGHCHPVVQEAAAKQNALLNTNTRYLHDTVIEYAERLCATLPDSLQVCFFVCSGSEANELALRLARAHTDGTDFIVVEGGYHGNTSTLIDISSYKFDGPGGAGPPPHVHKVMMPDCYRGRYKNHHDAGRLYADQVSEVLNRATNNDKRIAAFICESLLSCGGQIVLPPNYLTEVYQLVREAGGVCIADEVQVGFGRVGTHFWGFETQGVVPDIVTLGKPMGNGHPLGAVITTPAIAESFSNGMEYFNTFGGNPVSCAVGLSVLKVIESQKLQHHALTVGTYLKEKLRDLKTRYPLIGDVRGEGLFLGLEIVRDTETIEPAPEETMYIAERLKDRGVLAGTDGPHRNVVKIKPPMVFTQNDADRLVNTLELVLKEPRLELLGLTP